MGKNQHYIPRFLLRNFSEEESKRSLTTYYLKDKKIFSASIKDQASKDYIYGKDQTVETLLQRIEYFTANTISKLIKNEDPSLDDWEALKIFILFQLKRTPFNADSNNEIANLLYKVKYSNHPTIGNLIDKTKLELRNPYLISIISSIQTINLLSDLSIAIMENNTEISFVLGQHPAYIINPLLHEKKVNMFSQGIAVKGVCILLPISFKKIVIVYDKFSYKLIKNNNKVELNCDDVNLLNKYQFYYTSDCIYTKKGTGNNYLDTLTETTQNFRDKNILELQMVHKEGKKMIYEQTKIPEIDPYISILKIKNQAYSQHIIPTKECLARPSIIPELIKRGKDIWDQDYFIL